MKNKKDQAIIYDCSFMDVILIIIPLINSYLNNLHYVFYMYKVTTRNYYDI